MQMSTLTVQAGTPQICSRCRRTAPLSASMPRRLYSAAAVAPAETTVSTPIDPRPTKNNAEPATQNPFTIKSGIILTRPPLLTRPLDTFETSYFLYQKRLNERLSAPFRRSFYFKRDTAAELDWTIKRRERQGTAAKEIGAYEAQGRNAWDDEVLVGDTTASEESIRAALVRDAEMRVSEDGEEINKDEIVPIEPPRPRRTEADEKGDVRRLDRALERTLYLIVQGKDGKWAFPAGDVPTNENIHETASRILAEAAGVNMNTWMVGRVPVAHHVTQPQRDSDAVVKVPGQKTFFVKGRIMAGQADLSNNKLGLQDFKWLTREELEKELAPEYYESVKDMMADR